MAKELMSLRLPENIKDKLERLAEATGRTKTFIAIEAIGEYLDTQEWQIQAIQEGIDCANKGEFISHEDLKQKWESRACQ